MRPTDGLAPNPAPTESTEGIGLLGAGTVGTAVVSRLCDPGTLPFLPTPRIVGAAIRDPQRKRPAVFEKIPLTTDAVSLAGNPEVTILIDVMGGEEPALNACLTALARGIPVITANKELLALHWNDLQAAAARSGTGIYFSACVGGAVPMIEMMEHALSCDQILGLTGVLNATSNLVLQLAGMGQSLESALQIARAEGMAEADPSRDLSGQDALDKARLLSHLAWPGNRQVATLAPGVTTLAAKTALPARSLGLALAPVAICTPVNTRGTTGIWCGLGACELGHPLATLPATGCGLVVYSDLAGTTFVSGAGAGGKATTSAVLNDLNACLTGSRKDNVRPALTGLEEPVHATPCGTPNRWLATGAGTPQAAIARLAASGFAVRGDETGSNLPVDSTRMDSIHFTTAEKGRIAHSKTHWACLVESIGKELSLQDGSLPCDESFALLPVLEAHPGRKQITTPPEGKRCLDQGDTDKGTIERTRHGK